MRRRVLNCGRSPDATGNPDNGRHEGGKVDQVVWILHEVLPKTRKQASTALLNTLDHGTEVNAARAPVLVQTMQAIECKTPTEATPAENSCALWHVHMQQQTLDALLNYRGLLNSGQGSNDGVY